MEILAARYPHEGGGLGPLELHRSCCREIPLCSLRQEQCLSTEEVLSKEVSPEGGKEWDWLL